MSEPKNAAKSAEKISFFGIFLISNFLLPVIITAMIVPIAILLGLVYYHSLLAPEALPRTFWINPGRATATTRFVKRSQKQQNLLT